MVVRLERGESVAVESQGYCGVPGDEVLIVNVDGAPRVSMAGSAMSVSQPPAPNSAMAEIAADLDEIITASMDVLSGEEYGILKGKVNAVIARLRQ